jgi:hypothetical protein
MPKKQDLTVTEKATIVAAKLKSINWDSVNVHKSAGAEERVKIIRKFLKDHKIPHRSIFTVKKRKSGWNTSTEFDLKIRQDPDEVMTYNQARNELIDPITQMLKSLFPDSRNKSCGMCDSHMINWAGFCPDNEICQCAPMELVRPPQ